MAVLLTRATFGVFIFVGSQANGRFDPGVSLLKNFDLDDDGKVAFSEFAKLFGVDV
jgi:hypothetical protein